MKKMQHVRILVMGLLVLVASVGMAQKPIKPKLNKIESFLLEGDIASAREMADVAVTNEKLMTNAKTFYLHALTYVALDTAAATSGSVPNALETALSSFGKAQEMAGDKGLFIMEGGFPKTMDQHIADYYNYYYNEGVIAYQASDFGGAKDNFEKAQKIMPEQVAAYEVAGWASMQAEDYESTKANFYKVIELSDTASKDVYNSLATVIGSVQENYDEGISVIRDARQYYPADNDLARLEIDLLNRAGKVEEAKNNLITAIDKEPNDVMLRFFLGILYEQLANDSTYADQKEELMASALEAYKGGVEVDPYHYECNYNIGVLQIARANKFITERNNLGISKEDRKREEELIPLIQEELKGSLPTWERLGEIVSKEEANYAGIMSNPSADPAVKQKAEEYVSVLNTLKYLYTQLKMYDQAEEVIARIEATN